MALEVVLFQSSSSTTRDCKASSMSEPQTVETIEVGGTNNRSEGGQPMHTRVRGQELPNEDQDDDRPPDVVIGRLRALNIRARTAISRLFALRDDETYSHQQQFLRSNGNVADGGDAAEQDCEFVFSLANLPEFASIGWRLGRGRPGLKNLGVDILILADNQDRVAGNHCRFAWIKGGGGFFLIADNLRGREVNLNGESLSCDQRLIPFRNTIGIGECYFTIIFEERSPAQEEQFQALLWKFYTIVLQQPVPLIMATPSENETRVGEWILRNPLGKGSFGSVSIVTNARTGKPAAMKEIWVTELNRRSVGAEIKMAQTLLKVKHKRLSTPFELHHEKVHNTIEKQRIMKLLDATWKPGNSDTIDKYLLYSPLATSNFASLIRSNATKYTRAIFFTQVLEGIEFLHGMGIMHRDIKPGNLTVESYDPPRARIIDFGCATSEKTVLYDRPGTIPYLAPEQREGYTHDCTVDYWASAITGLQLLGLSRSREKIDDTEYKRIQLWITSQGSHPFLSCCDEMLRIEPRERLTATAALTGYLKQFREPVPPTGRIGSQLAESQSKRFHT